MKRLMINRMLLIAAVIFAFANFSSRAQSIEGHWYGYSEIQGMILRINIHITGNENGLTGTFDSPDQGAVGIPLTSIELDFPNLKFSYAPAGLTYAGAADPGFTQILGKFKQGSLEVELNFGRNEVELPENSIPRIMEIYNKKEVYITMRDGVRLFTSVYSPKETTGAAPILMTRTPYNIEGGGEETFSPFLAIYHRFVKEGYIFVFQDVRGRFMSEGEFENVRPFNPDKKGTETDEASDTYDTVEWLLENVENNNGRLGVFGVSYPGFYSTMALLAYHPAIKAVSPQAPVTNWWIGDDWHHNGAFMLLDGFSFYTFFGEDHPAPSRQGTAPPFKWGVQDNYEFFMRHGTIKELTETYFPDPDSYLEVLRTHPDYDDYWKSTDPRPHLKNIQPAVMTVGGWFDAEDCWGAQKTYEAIENQNNGAENILVMGPWSHGQWAGPEGENMGNIFWGFNANERFQQQEVDFFNHYLKGEEEVSFPEALIFDTGANKWVEFETWPPKEARKQTIFFDIDESLKYEKPQIVEGFDYYISDPDKPVPYTEDVHLRRTTSYMNDDQRFAARRPDVLVYQTEVLNEDITIMGPVYADLYVSTTGSDADFIVKLIDVFPDDARALPEQDIDMPLAGYQMLVRGEVFRGRYRNSFENPEPFVPGEISQVNYELPGIAHTFKKGHRLMVQVQSTWFPLVDRNPQKFVDIYNCDDTDFQKAEIRIFRDKKHPSGISFLEL